MTSPAHGDPPVQTTPEELACLAGGPRRAAEVAVARLADAGQLRLSREGFATATSRHGAATPLEARVLGELRRSGRYLPDLLSAVAESQEAAGLRAHLVDRGLLRARRSLRPRLYPWLFLLGFALIGAGVVSFVAPDVLSFVPVTVPGWAYFPAAVALIALAAVLGARDPGRLRTRAAMRIVRRAEAQVSSARSPERHTPHYRLRAVAVAGLGGQAALFGLTPAVVGARTKSSDGGSSCGGGCSSSSCSSSSSDGGSSCGGGCGGGGGD
ncbi:TIGR04222 domain-containing membrane protein [Lentzea chajnantorensis]